MIPEIYVREWAKIVPWKLLSMVEQDLLISRILIELYKSEIIRDQLVFR